MRVFICLFLYFLSYPTLAQQQTASDVFSDFVVKSLDEGANLNEVMGEGWSHQLLTDTQEWTHQEAHQFLEALKAHQISTHHILNILRVTFHLKQLKIWKSEDLSIEGAIDEMASDVFFDFVVGLLDGESDLSAVMGENWIDDLLKDTEDWTAGEAYGFLEALKVGINQGRIQGQHVLGLLQATPYLKWLKQEDFAFLQSSVQSVEEEITPQNDTQTGGDVFVAFARKHTDNLEQEMGSDWVREIKRYTNHKWTPLEAHEFLNFLVERTSVADTLRRIKSIRDFMYITMTYSGFMQSIDYFSLESHLGEAGVNHRLTRTLNGFRGFNEDLMDQLLNFIREYIGQEVFGMGRRQIRGGEQVVQEIMRKNHGALVDLVYRLKNAEDPENPSQDLLEPFKKFVALLERYIGKSHVINRMVSNFQGFAVVDFSIFPQVIKYLEDYVGDTSITFEKGILVDGQKLKTLVGGQAVVRVILLKATHSLTLVNSRKKFQKLQDLVSFLENENYLKREEIITRMIIDFESLTNINFPVFEKLVTYIEDYVSEYKNTENKEIIFDGEVLADGKAVVRAILLKYAQGLTKINSEEKLEMLQEFVKFLEEKNYLNQEQIINRMIADLRAFPKVNLPILEKLFKYIEDYVSEYKNTESTEIIFEDKVLTDGKAVVKAILFRNTRSLTQINSEEKLKRLQDFVKFLEDKSYLSKGEIIIRMVANFEAFCNVNLPIFQELLQYIEHYVKDKRITFDKKKLFVNGKLVVETKTLEGGRDVVREILLNATYTLTVINSREKLKAFKDFIEFLEEYIDQTAIIIRMVKNFRAINLTEFSLAEVKRLVRIIERHFGRQKVVETLTDFSINELRTLAIAAQDAPPQECMDNLQ